MFTVRANYSDTVEVQTSLDSVREFFADLTNFVDLMPGVESIHIDAKGIAHWTIKAEIPLIGSMMQKFALTKTEDENEIIEWSPVAGEAKNLFRFAAEFLEKGKNLTLVRFTQFVELRRNSARELHFLAGLAGEAIINSEMKKSVAAMIRTFVQKAKDKLEK